MKNKEDKGKRRRGTAFLFCLTISLFCLIISYKFFGQIKGTFFINPRTLKTTQGEIVSADLIFNAGKAPSVGYDITYNYQILGKYYFSRQVSFSMITANGNPAFARGYLAKYPEGRKVKVFYQANDPAFSVLEPYNKEGTANLAVGTLVVFLLSLVGLVWSMKNPKQL